MQKNIKVVVACSNASGSPEFVLTTIKMSENKRELGMHYDAAEKIAKENSYGAPMVCFDETEMPAFLKKAVKNKLIPEI